MEQNNSELADKPLDSEQEFENIIESALRFLGYRLHEAEQLTLREFSYEMYAHLMRKIDREGEIALQAHYIRLAKAQKEIKGKKGKTEFAYPTLKSLFDVERRIEELENGGINVTKAKSKLSKDKSLHDLLMNANK